MCTPATLQILAYDMFTVYLNGVLIAIGKSFPPSYVYLNLKDGINNLTITVTNLNYGVLDVG